MRELSEYREEILVRAAAMKRARARRKKMLTAAASLAACVILLVLAAPVLGTGLSGKKGVPMTSGGVTDGQAQETHVPEMMTEAPESVLPAAVLTGEAGEVRITDPELLARLTALTEREGTVTAEGISEAEAETKSLRRRMELTAEDGTKKAYLWRGGEVLTEESTGRKIALREEEVRLLEELFEGVK